MNLRETDQLRWKHFSMPAQLDHPISLWSALLDGRADGDVDVLYRWDPNSTCPLHRHTCAMSSLVLEGELTVVDIDPDTGRELGRVVKSAGTWVHKQPGDVHAENGWPEGTLALANLYTEDGLLLETLAADGRVIDRQTMEPILAAVARREAAGAGEGN